jgi:hypothetical protein
MPKRRDVVAEQLRELADDIDELWRAVTRDPQKEARRERAWTILSGAAGVAATMAVRRALVKLWPILTGETPPIPRPGQPATTAAPAQAQPPPQGESGVAQAEPSVGGSETRAPAEPQPQHGESGLSQAEGPTESIATGSQTAER